MKTWTEEKSFNNNEILKSSFLINTPMEIDKILQI